MKSVNLFSFLFFFNDTATTEIYTLSLHDALPICWRPRAQLACLTDSMTERYESERVKSPVLKYLPTMPMDTVFFRDLIFCASATHFPSVLSFGFKPNLPRIFKSSSSFAKLTGTS